jgi:hypothetical protein
MAKKQKTKAETTAETTATEQPQESTQAPAPGMTLQDLVLVAQIIQLSSQRGAFRADELKQIGGLYEKLIAFLQSTGAINPAPTEEQKND